MPSTPPPMLAAGLDCPLTDHHAIHLLDGLHGAGQGCAVVGCILYNRLIDFQNLTPRWYMLARFTFRSLRMTIEPLVDTS